MIQHGCPDRDATEVNELMVAGTMMFSLLKMEKNAPLPCIDHVPNTWMFQATLPVINMDITYGYNMDITCYNNVITLVFG